MLSNSHYFFSRFVYLLDAPLDPFTEVDFSPDKFDYWSEFLRMFLTLGIILGSVLIGAYLLKKVLNKKVLTANESYEIKIIERRALSQKANLYLIQVKDKEILISDSASGIQFLVDCKKEELDNESKEFAEIFEKLKKEKLLKAPV